MKSETSKLPKGQSYPLKPTALEAAFKNANVTIDVHLISKPGDLFDAHFWPPNDWMPHERLYIRAGTVAKEKASAARIRMETNIIPSLVEWIGGILALDSNSPVRREQQRLEIKPFE